MSRTQAISALQAVGVKATLTEIYGIVVESVMKSARSIKLKSNNYTGDPASGSAEFKRFANAKSKPYGTARAAGKGDVITAVPVPVNVDTHREIVEEMSKFDATRLNGPEDVLRRRAPSHTDSMEVELDTAFFTAAAAAATAATLTGTDELDQLEQMIQLVETVKNDYVEGVERSMISVTCSPAFFGKIRTKIDTLPKGAGSEGEEIGYHHGAEIGSSTRIPAGLKMIAMAFESIAQPVVTDPYTDPTKIPLSNDYSVELYYDYGTKVLAEDLIFKA